MPSILRAVYEGTDLATSSASIYAPPAATRATVTKATVINHAVASATFSVWILPSGVGATADRYLLVQDRAIQPYQTYDVAELRSHTLEPGDAIWAVASAANRLAIRISAQVVT